MKNPIRSIAPIALTLAIASSAFATLGVSPGGIDRVAVVNNACPTFSWGFEPNAEAYEVVAYELAEDQAKQAELVPEQEVLYTRVTGTATGWTPSADQCFAPGGRYVWFVRAVTELIDDQVIVAGEWSAGRYFEVPAGPSEEEMRRAIEVLNRWEAVNGTGSLMLSSATATAADSGTGSGSGAGSSHRKSVPTASAAIRGEHPDVTGEVYGVVGTSASADGAGVAAANLDGGPDLVLDGSASGEVDTLVNEDMLKRSSPDDLIFLFHNGGGGVLDLHVHGSLNGDGLNVQYGPVIDDAGNWLGVGDTIPCPGCVASADIADGSIIDNDLADDAVTEEKIEHGAVGTTKLQNNSVTSFKIADGTIAEADLADNAVTSAKIGDGVIATSDLAGGSVTSIKIADGAVGGAKLAAGSVTSTKILDGTVATADLADNSVTGGKIVDGAVDVNALRNGAVTSAKIFDGTITGVDLAAGSVGTGQIANGAVTGTKIGMLTVGAGNLMDWAVTTDKIEPGAVINSKIAVDAVSGSNIANDTVYSSDIHDGTLTAADVDPTGGIYASKTSVYYSVKTNTLEPGDCVVDSADCADENDLAIEGACGLAPNSPMRVRTTSADNWDSLSEVASWTCDICYETTGFGVRDVTTSILCISVPGP